VSTTTKTYGQPALVGGLVMGWLSALPIIYFGNICCCLWVVSGGLVAAYLLQQNQSTPITAGDGALVGLLAGLAGALIHFLISIPIDLLMAPFERQMAERLLEMAGEMPPWLADVLQQASQQRNEVGIGFIIASRVVVFMIMLCIGAIFSTLGGLLGAVIFRKETPSGTLDVPPSTPSDLPPPPPPLDLPPPA
jgi:hypothetical protein